MQPSMAGSGGAAAATATPLRSCHGSLIFSDTAVMFRTMLNTVAEKLTPENIRSLAFIHEIAEGDAKEGPLGLCVLHKLVKRGAFSADHLEPLEEMLDGISRSDINNTVIKEFKLKLKGSVRRSDSDPSLSMRRTLSFGTSCGCGTVDPLHSLTSSRTEQQSWTKDEKRSLFLSLASDPELEGDVNSLVQRSQPSPASSLGYGSQTRETVTHQQSADSRGSVSSELFSSPETSLSQRQSRPDGSLPVLPESSSQAVTTSHESTLLSPLHTQTSEEDFINVNTNTPQTSRPHPPSTPSTKRMEWSICRVGLGQRIVRHSNIPFIKGHFSLTASGIRRRLRKPVSLIFKVYPFGLGSDENQSLTLETVVECRSEDLRSLAKVNLTVTLSMDSHSKFISTRTWEKPLKTFLIHDFLPHEVITHNDSKTLDLVFEAYITFD